MYKEFEIVTAKRKLSDNVEIGDIGTIVMIYKSPNLAYEVEFVNSDQETIDILTVLAEDIDLA